MWKRNRDRGSTRRCRAKGNFVANAAMPQLNLLWPGAMAKCNAEFDNQLPCHSRKDATEVLWGPHMTPNTSKCPRIHSLCTTPRMSNMRDCLCQRACVGELQVVMQINIRIRLDFPKNVHYKLQIGLCLLNSCYPLAVFM